MPTTSGTTTDADRCARHDRDQEVLRLLRRAHVIDDPDQAAKSRERAIELLIGWAHSIASRYARRGVEVDDLRQVAAIAVVLAVDRFDLARQSSFFAYLGVTVHGELKRHLRDYGWSVRPARADHDRYHHVLQASGDLTQSLGAEPTAGDIAEHLGIEPELVRAAQQMSASYTAASLDTMLAEHPGMVEEHARNANTVDVIDAATTAATLDHYLKAFSPRDRLMLALRFEQDLTQREIGEYLGINQMQVSRVLSAVLTRLRETLADTFYNPAC